MRPRMVPFSGAQTEEEEPREAAEVGQMQLRAMGHRGQPRRAEAGDEQGSVLP